MLKLRKHDTNPLAGPKSNLFQIGDRRTGVGKSWQVRWRPILGVECHDFGARFDGIRQN